MVKRERKGYVDKKAIDLKCSLSKSRKNAKTIPHRLITKTEQRVNVTLLTVSTDSATDYLTDWQVCLATCDGRRFGQQSRFACATTVAGNNSSSGGSNKSRAH